MKLPRSSKGFTFIEVLVAMAIFTLAVLAAVDISGGAVRAARDSKEMSVATWLLQEKMVELETKLETEGIEKGCDKKDSGKFSEPFQNYTWESACEEIDFFISETASKMAAAQGQDGKEEDASTQENQILKLILKTAGDYITQSTREVHVEVKWQQGKAKRAVDATTHFVRYDQKVALPGAGGGTTGGGTDPTQQQQQGGTTTQ